jgi:phosphodiesterase/alkaline phosphatase D-like protein
MPRTLFALGIMLGVSGMILSNGIAGGPGPDSDQPAGARITEGPVLERATAGSAIIRWTTTNPGGTDLHYAIAHYGTGRENLTQISRSPNRRNRNHADMIFRVRLDGLRPGTTYYYWVESVQANGVPDSARSSLGRFTTPRAP